MLSLPLPVTAADAFGAAAFAGSCLWPLMKKRRALLAGQAATNLMFIIHYVLLGAHTAAALCLLVVTQALVAMPEGRNRWQTAAFAATVPAIAAIAVFTWSGLPSALSSLGITFSTLARWQSDAVRMRLLLLVAGAFWISHNAVVMSPFAMASDLFSAAANLLRLRGERRKTAPAAAATANANAAPKGLAAA
ncbi:YgjV family protein [Azospirillum humicireducens]|uniref:YgjV family protein n=1 Tax=Azospirillum humicireducens TaxID=1226968 RepID=A0A168XZ94_9PROT|nr:YgjV family protein [Azospirillum humicireducens]ANC90537.1 YgjV family protein [Azospirillum humicireducens]